MFPCRLALILSVLLAAYTAAALLLIFSYLWVFYLIVFFLIACNKTVNLTSGGTARWAVLNDLWHLVDGAGGLILGHLEGKVGRVEGVQALFSRKLAPNRAVRRFLASCQRRQARKLVRLNNAVHTAVFAPTGVGKGVSIVLPLLLTCRDSMVIVDFKGENYKISAQTRRRMGHRIICLDPFNVVGGTDTFNPLDFIGSDEEDYEALDDCRALANALVLRAGTESEPHWNDSAEGWICAFIALIVKYGSTENRSLQTTRPLLTDLKKLREATDILCGTSAWGGMLARLGHQLTHAKEKELGSVLTTVNRHMRWLDTVLAAKSTHTSSFNPAGLTKSKMTIYLVLPPTHQREQSPMLRMWIGSLLKAVVKGGLQETRKVHFVLDEAASLGHMDAIDDAVDKYRGYGIRLLFIYQSLGQLKHCFPAGQEQTLLSNVSQIFFGVNDPETARYVSERLGEGTIWVEGRSSSRGWSHSGESNKPYGSSGGTSQDYKQQSRALLKVDEVLSLDPRVAICFHSGVRPIATYLVRYYEGNFLPHEIGLLKAAFDAFCLLLVTSILAVGVTALALNR